MYWFNPVSLTVRRRAVSGHPSRRKWRQSGSTVLKKCVCVGLKRTTRVIHIPLCLYISMWLPVSLLGAWLFHTCVSMKEWVCIISVGERGERSLDSLGGSSGAELNSQISRKSSWLRCFHSRNFLEVKQGSSSNWLIIAKSPSFACWWRGKREAENSLWFRTLDSQMILLYQLV